MALLTDAQIIERYGQPANADNFTIVGIPYPMRIAWDTSVVVRKIQCHEDIQTRLLHSFEQILKHYGLKNIQDLGIDLFGGCVNVRTMRGSKTKWSRHAWGIAIDLAPQFNQLKWGRDKAIFAKLEYEPMLDIFYANEFLSYGREKNFDWMHIEISK